MFEYLSTLSDEIRFFWGGRLTGAVALFLANRYLTLGYFLYTLGASINPSSLSAIVCAHGYCLDVDLDAHVFVGVRHS